MSNPDHAALVEAALARAAKRDAAGRRRPDDVLAVEVRRLRRSLELRDQALATVRAQLAEADAKSTTGGRHLGYDVPKAWRNADLPAPPSAADPTAPPLGRAAARPRRTVETGEEL